ncbi:MAG: DUF3397 domain-containing protein [Neobacillus sp.]
MTSVISLLLAIFLTIPVLGFILIFILARVITNNLRSSLHKAFDYSTLLFILAVHFLIITIWGKSFLWLIVLFMIIIAMAFAIIHWKVKGEIDFNKVFKGFWRFNFLFFFIAYFTLTVFGLLHRAFTFTFFS